MKFGIDYDHTFSDAPEMFRKILDLIHEYGHEAVIVTQRPASNWNKDLEENVQGKVEVVYAGSKWKSNAAIDKGHFINVWMDDNPQCISEPPYIIGTAPNYELTKEVLNALIKSNLVISGLLASNEDRKYMAQEVMNKNTTLIKQIENKPPQAERSTGSGSPPSSSSNILK